MREGNVLLFKDVQERRYKEAFDWAVKDQKRHGFLSRPARFDFHGEDILEYDKEKCRIAMFYNEENDWAILRRDWPEKLATAYNVITNYDEVKRVAPNSLKELLDNGVEMYEQYKAVGLG